MKASISFWAFGYDVGLSRPQHSILQLCKSCSADEFVKQLPAQTSPVLDDGGENNHLATCWDFCSLFCVIQVLLCRPKHDLLPNCITSWACRNTSVLPPAR